MLSKSVFFYINNFTFEMQVAKKCLNLNVNHQRFIATHGPARPVTNGATCKIKLQN